MKRLTALAAALAMVLSLAACGKRAEDTELVVFAAASLQETLTEIGERYMRGHEGVSLVFNFDSSGTLKTQIQEGAVCDVFISAGQKQMDELDAAVTPAVDANAPAGAGLKEALDLVDSNSRFDLLENKVVLAVPDGNPADIDNFDGLKAGLEAGSILLAMGNSDVPVGQYTQKILAYYGLDEKVLAGSGVITYGSNVKEVATQVFEGAVDCGVIYATDAFSAGLTVVDAATAEMCGRVVYPAAVLKNSRHPDEAQAFLDYVRSADGTAVLESVGFTPLAEI